MKVKILREAGVEEALLGLSLSYNSEPSMRVADRLAHKQGGHNKFLESVQVWVDVTAPRYFWQEFDTYRVGTTKQSESTIHTLTKKRLTQDSFEGEIYQCTLDCLNADIEKGLLVKAKRNLPEAYLQRRVVGTNYKVLQNITAQRKGHKLTEWQFFLDAVLEGIEFPQWVKK